MFGIDLLKSLLFDSAKRKDSVAAMKPNLPIGDALPCRIPIVTGITCVVGVIGSALLLVHGVKYFSQVSQRRQKKVQVDRSSNEEVGGKSVKSHADFCYKCNIKVCLEDITTFAICRCCDQTVCRSKLCSDWDRTTGYWECLTCINNRDGQVRAGEWILDQLNRRFKKSTEHLPQEDSVTSHRDVETQSEHSVAESTYSISIQQKAKVREFLEEIISELVGGSLDEVPVTQLHSDRECKYARSGGKRTGRKARK